MNKVLLIIRDGWGIGKKEDKYNAVAAANTPNINSYLNKYPNCVLESSGEAVGLPNGYQGSSEVGHLNIGAGRIVIQELKRIKDMIEDGTFFETQAMKNVLNNAVKNNSTLHLMGLVQDEGVHAHQDHLYAIIEKAVKMGIKNIRIHFFADGRDTPPRSALSYLKMLEDFIKDKPQAKVATIIGRYFAMDRGEKWSLIDKSYNAITLADGLKFKTAKEAFDYAYEKMKNPTGEPVVDEYIEPCVIGDYAGMKDGDSVIHFNFRQDRAIELTKAFIEENYPGKRHKKYDIAYCGLTKYYDSFPFSALPPMSESGNMDNLLGQIISRAGLKQLRISETQKFKHVTSFFNGKKIEPEKGEDRIEIKGSWDPSAFALHPEMDAYPVTDRCEKEINSGKYDFILVNFANGDMVGHTGDFKAAVKAVETVDECVGRLVKSALSNNYTVMISADHGNSEEMWDYKINMPKTSHTINPVEFILISPENKKIKLRERGILADIAPTVLDIIGLEKPQEMTAESLIRK
ncbi:MAG: 2,3-bisphosphoglycerate-independent phosphoglycerate mutase [Elusimicrobia bacterium]|nr:2,3-bisphosphoglycerate-independent phosphoglycerate mutase [Elusimicrobiota bacterium]